MAKKEMMMEGAACCGNHKVCRVVSALVIAVLGLLLMWPKGWFTFNHSLGLLVFLMGLNKLWHSYKCGSCCH